uniref:Thiol-disulfide oxidoreductase DCC n=1 Tax=Leersia perrieri TaxID=77586 RepID=A0A0D9WNQ4_9ORYZ
MLARTLAARVRPLLAPPLAAAGLRGYAARAPSPRPSSSSSAAAAAAATLLTILQPRVLIYDGVCHLCHRGVKWVIKADKHAKIRFCCVQSKAAEPYLRLVGMDREDVLRRVLFIEGPEAYYEGSTAALKVASYLPLPYSALSSLLIIPTPLRDAIYDYIAKNRYDWFGKDDECIVIKDKELLERFIDREEMLGGGPSNSF